MPRRRTIRRVLVASAFLLALLLGVTAWSSWDHLRFWWLFEPLGTNAQGYPEYRHRQTGMVLVRLPGGTFWMGAQPEDPAAPNYDPDTDLASSAEHTVHRVTLSPFLVGKYEVTQAEWESVMESNPSRFRGRYALPGVDPGSLPVDSVYRDELQADGGFLDRTGLRLPTEAQWEYACRAGTGGPVPGTGDLDEMAWYDDKPEANVPIVFPPNPAPPLRGKTRPVGTKRPNDFGLHDVLGNVEEWVEDSFRYGFYHESADSKDPLYLGPEGSDGIFRGGSWDDADCDCAHRDGWRTSDSRVSTFGFRACYYPFP